MDEVWLPLYQFEDLYEVSSLGRIRDRETQELVPQYQTSKKRGYKYRRVRTKLRKTAAPRYNHTVARLVAHTFHPSSRLSPVIRHLNDDPTDNRAENLAGGTHLENRQDAIRNGKILPGYIHRESFRQREERRELVRAVGADARHISDAALAEKYGLSLRAIGEYRREAGVLRQRGRPRKLISLTNATNMC